jgi:hypothetical protein
LYAFIVFPRGLWIFLFTTVSRTALEERRTIPCRLFATAYSVNSRLPIIPGEGGDFLIRLWGYKLLLCGGT